MKPPIDWSEHWLAAKKDLRDYMDEANAGNWELAGVTAERLTYCAIMLEQYAKSRKSAGD